MVRHLARSIRPVMAALATPGKRAVIDNGGIAETIGRMTFLTAVTAFDVIERFSDRLHKGTLRMAGRAGLGGFFEYPVSVALLAG